MKKAEIVTITILMAMIAGPAYAEVIAEHDFSDEAQDGGSGWAGAWQGDWDLRTFGDLSDPPWLRLWGGDSSSRAVDLSAWQDVTLTFDVDKEGGQADGDEFLTEFYDGTTWHEVDRWTVTSSYDDAPVQKNLDLSSYTMAASSEIRFSSTCNQGYDRFELDNVTVDGTPFELLEGDYNDDGFVAQGDLDLVLLNWGDTGGAPEGWVNDAPAEGDLIGQGYLDKVLLNWGEGTAPTSTVPEPLTMTLLGLGGVCVLARRRRRS